MLDKNTAIYTDGPFIVAPLLNIDLIATAYLRLKREGVLDVLYYEADPGLPKVLAVMTDPATINFGCFMKRDEDVTDFVGIGHVAAPLMLPNGQKKAEISVAFFKGWQRRDVTIPLAQMMIEWVFRRSDIDFLFGTTPEPNRAMLRFMKALGFGHTAEPIPNFTCWHGVPCGVFVSWMDARRWKEVTPFPDSQ
jgi:hypothetical protein